MSSDSEDDVQDWLSVKSNVLKRGEKDHSPDGTDLQQSSLQKSREAMYSALSHPAGSSLKNIVECDWVADKGLARIRKLKGNFFNTMGFVERGSMYLRPEELIYLVQRGTVVCYNPHKMSLQAVMALTIPLIGNDNVLVYSYLRRLGYTVQRTSSTPEKPAAVTRWPNLHFTQDFIWVICGRWIPSLAWKPFYTTYSSIYRDLQLVNAAPIRYTPEKPHPFMFNVWKPQTKFKKSLPPPPDFQILVVSADFPFPDLERIEDVMMTLKPSKSTKESVITRTRGGYRKHIYAIVDNGIVSFITATQTEFEPTIYEPSKKQLLEFR